MSDRVERARLPAWSEISKSLASLGCAVDLRAAVAEPLQKLGLVDVHTSDRGGAYVRGDVGVGTLFDGSVHGDAARPAHLHEIVVGVVCNEVLETIVQVRDLSAP